MRERNDYFKNDELARQVWESKYKLGNETLYGFFERITYEFARLDNFSSAVNLEESKLNDLSSYGKSIIGRDPAVKFRQLFTNFKYIIPGGSVLAGVGSDKPVSLSNCFVIKNGDSISEIFDASKNMAQIYKRRGGCIEEHTPVIIKNKGNISIKDVEIGDYILSFNIVTLKDEWKLIRDKYYTEVSLEDQIELNYVNGVKLKTSKKHPILTLSNTGYDFINEKSGKLLNTTNKSPNLRGFEYEKVHQSNNIQLTDVEIDFITNYKYSTLFPSTSKEYQLLKTSSYDLNKNKTCGKEHLSLLKNHGIITEEKYFEILSRTKLVEITEDNSEKLNYIDISVEENNNYYAGTFGFVNIHNCGVDLGELRPASANVNNAAKTTGGVVPFMELFSQVTNTIGQNGRRGALMLSIDINHPDSPDFINSKQDLSKITGANISVKLNDEFMNAVEKNEDYWLQWPTNYDISGFINQETPYNQLINHEVYNEDGSINLVYIKKIRAKELWDSVIQCAWNTAEPGILFWDNILNNDPASVYPEFKAVSTNPCGEIPLSPYDSCRLIASNVYNLVEDKFKPTATINEALAYEVFYEAQIIGDILVDLEAEYVQKIIDITDGDEKGLWEKIKEIGLKGRRTGVGLTGYADMCAALGKNYGDEELTDYIMKLKMRAELDATIDLAIINEPFPSYNRDLEFSNSQETDENLIVGKNAWYNFLIKKYPEQFQKMLQYGRRNVSFSTIAPTGTISMLAATSSGCEPTFSLYYKRRKKCNPGEKADFTDQNGVNYTEHNVVHGSFKKWYEELGWLLINGNADILTLSTEELDKAFRLSPWFNNIANDIEPSCRVKTQAIMQQYITHSISSTINLPPDTTQKVINLIYKDAWEQGLKGVTVYRDGCRSGILVSHKEEEKPIITERPFELECKVVQFKNEKKDWIAFVGILNGIPYEIFTGPKDLDTFPIPSSVVEGIIIKVKNDDEPSRYDFRYVDSYGYTNTLGGLSRIFDKEYWNYARLMSALLREQVSPEKMITIIEGLNFSNKSMTNWKSGVIRSFKPFVQDGTKSHGEKCSECGQETIVYEAGCKICKNCGNSRCS